MNGSNLFPMSYTHTRWQNITKNCHQTLELWPFENVWVNFIFLKRTSKQKSGTFFINYINLSIQKYYLGMLFFRKIQNGDKKLTGSELNKIKLQLDSPKFFKKIIFCHSVLNRDMQGIKFLQLSNIDCQSYIYAIKNPFTLSRSSFKARLFCRIFLGLTV